MSKDPLLVNKIFGAILVAAWTVVFAAFGGALLYHPTETVEKFAYPIGFEEAAPAEEPAAAEESTPTDEPATAEEPAAAAAEPAAGIAALLAGADADAGSKVARKCAGCHTFDEGGANRIGPNLWNIVNRPVAEAEGYNYSLALDGIDGEWTYERLDDFLAAPKDFAPGTKMGFTGIAGDDDRANLIAYLRSLSGNPAPLP